MAIVHESTNTVNFDTALLASPLRHAYHMVSGEEGHARLLSAGRVSFAPGGHKFSFVCVVEEVCLGPAVQEGR
jgi:hypothetical protein